VFWVEIIVFSSSPRFGWMIRNRGLLRSVFVAGISNLKRQLAVARFKLYPLALTKPELPEPVSAKAHHGNVAAAVPQAVDGHALQS